jgi:hypothetical protein
VLRFFTVAGQWKKLLVDLPALINICMKIDLRGLDGCMPKVLLYNLKVLGTFVELTRIAVSDLVGGDTRRSVIPEDMLDRPRGDMLALLADKQRPDKFIANKFPDLRECLVINKNDPDLVTFPPDPYRVLIKIDILNIHVAKLRDAYPGGIDCTDDKTITWIFDGINQPKNLAMLKVLDLLMLDPWAFDTA